MLSHDDRPSLVISGFGCVLLVLGYLALAGLLGAAGWLAVKAILNP